MKLGWGRPKNKQTHKDTVRMIISSACHFISFHFITKVNMFAILPKFTVFNMFIAKNDNIERIMNHECEFECEA